MNVSVPSGQLPTSALSEGSYPPPVVAVPFTSVPTPGAGASGTAPINAPHFYPGLMTEVPSLLNSLSARTDALMASMTGVSCLIDAACGIALGSRTFTLYAGLACVGGLLSIESNLTFTVALSSTSYLWLTQQGTLVARVGDMTPPVGVLACYLGRVVTNGTGATSWDSSGSLRLVSGLLVRDTGDTVAPTTALPAGIVILTRCPAGSFLWDGSSHRTITATASLPVLETVFIDAGGTTISSVPSTTTEVLGGRTRSLVNIAGYGTTRLIAQVASAGFAGTRLYVQYSTDAGGTWSDFMSGITISAGLAISGWQAIPVGALAEVQLRLCTDQGDGSASVSLGRVALQCRVSSTTTTTGSDGIAPIPVPPP